LCCVFPIWHERQAVELFHLLFLRALGARIDKTLFVLTGGCYLRFFHHRVRYSRDMGLDIRTMATAMLRSNVDQVITGHALRQSLLAQGLLIVDATSPKQTTTTQHRKVSLRDTDSGICVPARVEFSQRNLGECVPLEAITPGIQPPAATSISSICGQVKFPQGE
jgi:hypothetical protein